MIEPKGRKKYNTKKRWPRVFLGVIVMLLVTLFGLQFYGKHLLSKVILKKAPKNIELSYADLDFNILFGNVGLYGVKLSFYDPRTKETKATVKLEALKVLDIHYWSLWKKEQFIADSVSIEKADMLAYKKTSDDVYVSIKEASVDLGKFKIDSKKIKEKIPFQFSKISLDLKDVYLNLSRFEELELAKLSYKNNYLEFQNIFISSKYDKMELSKRLQTERDYVDFKLEKGFSRGIYIKEVKDSIKVFAETFNLNNSELHLFRDKLLPDDFRKKMLYGALLRNLPFKLNIETVLIENTNVFYSERINEAIEPVSISFENLNAKIDSFSNENNKNIDIAVNTDLMGEAPLQFNWSFNPLDKTDAFNASAILTDLDAKSISPFLESQANVKALGRIHELYFTIHGNDFRSMGDMKMKYEDFKFTILDEDQLRINKTLTAIVNIFTNDGSKTDLNGYRYGNIEVERDKTKSFFNYLWLNTKEGLKNTVIGNGKK
jgi:hypothetical protein